MDIDYEYADGGAQEKVEIPKGLTRSGICPSPFEISLMTYPSKPWTNRNTNLSEWFNYGFNPTTWTKYCLEQIHIFKTSNGLHEVSEQGAK
jgi:hypothetical protein